MSSTTSDRKIQFDHMALGVITYLESFPEVRTVTFQGNDPAQGSEITTWERKNNPFKLPADLKAFYSTFNGFNLSWSIDIGDRMEVIGEMKINKLDNVRKSNVDFFVQDHLIEDVITPVPNSCSLFVLDSSCSLGEIVLLYRSNGSSSNSSHLHSGTSSSMSTTLDEPEVWLLDSSAQLTYICKTFTHYMRLLVTHLGIHGWQSMFQDSGWSLTTQHWMHLFCKERLIVDRQYKQERALFLEKKSFTPL